MQKHLQHLLILCAFLFFFVFFYRCGCHLTLLKVTKIFHGAESKLIHDSETVNESWTPDNIAVWLLLVVEMVN